MLRTIGSVGALTLLVSSATAQLIVGNDQSGTASIYYIDVGTGAATAIYSASDGSAKPWGMAYDPGSNTLYWNNGGSLFSSPYGNPLVPSAAVPMTFNGATVNYVGLAWQNGKLLGTRNISTEAVYEIDPSPASRPRSRRWGHLPASSRAGSPSRRPSGAGARASRPTGR